MFLHIGKSYSIPIDDIVAIMDVNSLLNSKDSKSYLKKMKEKGLLFITNSDERNIKTIILTSRIEKNNKKGKVIKNLIYTSEISSSTLLKRNSLISRI
ncbi:MULTISPECIES: extracellular matrix/biofilm biosynthesis regulator RemA family protein [Tissierellales]|jgi:hypothetical protein|uniref:DUF370 domain-containing protein n=1 Tax=Acidilutibacter cellobiosedens TaxID=2507161 RepID=A0A410Q7Z6_9FIRM|nr:MULTISPECIES: extracellular matrix/biofilm biosynthesis regulator RemA family protein [Tissierellales]MBE6082931.1 DUF370 domain-containing protein [Tissierellaceae bacterium]QAT60072.1 DUF370 domain-containing protein [Acidilutibacter cellobiosedens]SCL96411.1 hypothetical protein PP176A_3064 [Sporanaerobacter sp. PP17-6a]